MNDLPAQAAMGWGGKRRARRSHGRMRLRDVIPPIGAVTLLTVAHLLYGASNSIAALMFSILFTGIALSTIFFAGPRHVTLGMVLGAATLAVYGFTGLAGPIDRAAPHLAVLVAAGALWIVGYVASRHRGALDAAWTGLIWGSLLYCGWMFAADVSASMSTPDGGAIFAAFVTPAAGSVLFGLFALIGMARVLHVMKQMDAEGLGSSQMIERVLRDGLSGILLVALAVTCLVILGSRAGLVLALGVLIGHAWWDMLPVATRPHRGLIARLLAFLAPFAAIALVVWGVSLAWLEDETIAPGIGLTEQLPNIQRLEAYMAAWMEKPVLGHGLGSIGVVGDQTTTLFNAKAMLAPGGAHNVFATWLVETGLIGLSLLILVLGAMHARMVAALGSRKTPRTFLRLAIAAGLLLLLHGVTDSSLDLPSATWLYALLLGAACGVATGRRIDPEAAEEETGG